MLISVIVLYFEMLLHIPRDCFVQHVEMKHFFVLDFSFFLFKAVFHYPFIMTL